MPCRDDWPEPCRDYKLEESNSARKKLQKRNDELAAENCQLRGLLCHLNDKSDMSTLWDLLTPAQSLAFKKALKDQKLHRKKDKDREIKAKARELNEYQTRQTAIKKLGGVPGKELLDEIKLLKASLVNLKKSDPMATELY